MSFRPGSCDIVFSASQVAIQIPFSNTSNQGFGDTPSVSIDAVCLALSVKWQIVNHSILLRNTAIILPFTHAKPSVCDPFEFLFDPNRVPFLNGYTNVSLV